MFAHIAVEVRLSGRERELLEELAEEMGEDERGEASLLQKPSITRTTDHTLPRPGKPSARCRDGGGVPAAPGTR
ncbi:MAG: hypothetical protein ACLSDQ_05575 [Adlercreutzia equolifaciens]